MLNKVRPEEHLRQIRDGLKTEDTVPSVTVREFLSWFGAHRRGYWIVDQIRQFLNEFGIATEPDFRGAYIDSLISFRAVERKSEHQIIDEDVESESVEIAEVNRVVELDSAMPSQDPTYRIGKLAAANRKPLSVKPDALLSEAATMMMVNDFSQMPVMTTERDVKGVISWSSIAQRMSLNVLATKVRDLMDSHNEVASDASLFQAIPAIVQHQYVLVRAKDEKIAGIVTASDLSLQFQQLAEPFLLLGEVENHVRGIIRNYFPKDELVSAVDDRDPGRGINNESDLSLGEYIRLLENREHWERIGMPIDRAYFCNQLHEIRHIRNSVMHFDPDGVEDDRLEILRDFVRYLRRLHSMGITG